MSIFDITNLFCEDQAIVADAASTNIIDLGATGTPFGASAALVRDIGKGCKVPLSINITETFNNLTSIAVQLQVDDNSGFATPRVVSEKTYLLADLIAGKQLPFPDDIPEGASERYMRLFFDITGAAPTTGKITAGAVAGRHSNFVGGQ